MRLHPKLIDLSLGRMTRLLDALDNPQLRLPPVVHVAGTNGKGSTLAFLRAILEAAGQRVHVYTSPHLVRFNERIRLAGVVVDDATLIEVLEDVEAANGDAPITFFEVTTAAALTAFAHVPADVVLLETGLGGRLDATNVVPRPALTALTPIDIDHKDFLGTTLAAIAAEKAAIQKPGVVSVVAPQRATAARVIAAAARQAGAPLARAGREWDLTADRRTYRDADRTIDLPVPALAGAHQVINAGVAVASALRLPFAIADAHVAQGLAAATWPARLDRLDRGRLPALLPSGSELWLDGGHNAAAGAALAQHAAGWRDRPLFLVFGMMASKDASAFLRPLAPHVAGLHAVAVPDEPGALHARDAAAAARAVGIPALAAPDVESALDAIGRGADGPVRVLVCGSLYLAGAALGQNAPLTPAAAAAQ